MFNKERIYSSSPIWVQNTMVSMYGYQWKKRRFGGIFEKELKGFKDRESFTKQQWRDYQTVRLREILCHAYQFVPFYHEKYKKRGFRLNSFKKFELSDLPKLPVLEKHELREFGKTSLLSTKKDKLGSFFSSSGSTGTPTEIYISKSMHQKWSAGFEARIRNWAGVDRFIPRGMIGGRRIVPNGNAKSPFYRYNYFEKQTYFSAYHISAQTAHNYLEGMLKNNVQYMTGYATSNYILAKFIKDHGLKAPNLKAVITSSEKLTFKMRELFQEVYGCQTFDSYSGVEDCGLISECEKGALHISPDLGIIEFLDKEENNIQKGEIVCTGLINYDQPLIRYKIGDEIQMNKETICSCGREMPVVDEIIGRVEDIVIGQDGRKMVRFHGIFVNIPEILEAQVIQHYYDEFEIKLSTLKPLSEQQEQVIVNRMKSQLGEIKLDLIYVNKIPRNRNGKFKAVISKLKN